VTLGLLAASASAVFFGLASVLQARAAHATAGTRGSVFRMLVRSSFVVGVLLDIAGFAAQFVALQVAPVFLVQATQAGNLAVTAVVAVPMLKIRLSTGEWIAVAAVCLGLAGLGLSAASEGPAHAPMAFRLALLGAAALLTLAGIGATRRAGPVGSAVLGLVAGLQFGVVALAVRTITDLSVGALVREPAVYAMALGGAAGFLCFAVGLQKGRVTVVTSAVVIGETLPPALIGIALLGDHTRPGLTPLAVAGFAAALAGAAMLARFGEVKA